MSGGVTSLLQRVRRDLATIAVQDEASQAMVEELLAQADHALKEVQAENLSNMTNSYARLPMLHNVGPLTTHSKSASPGSRVQNELLQQLITNPVHPKSRRLLKEKYGVQLPELKDERPKGGNINQGNMQRGSTVPLARLQDNSLQNLLRFLPAHTEVAMKQAAITQGETELHLLRDKYQKAPTERRLCRLKTQRQNSGTEIAASHSNRTMSASNTDSRSQSVLQAREFHSTLPAPPPGSPAPNNRLPGAVEAFVPKVQRLAFQHGVILSKAEAFVELKKEYILSWGPVVTLMERLGSWLQLWAIPLAFIDGMKLVRLAQEEELRPRQLDQSDWLALMFNADEVLSVLMTPGQKYRGRGGKDRAATKIQSHVRRISVRREYIKWRQQKWNTALIAIQWLMRVKMTRVRKMLRQVRADQRDATLTRNARLAAEWKRVKARPHVVIHIPSMGYPLSVRNAMADMGRAQNTQLTRLCDIADPNVTVIYVSPVQLTPEDEEYFERLLALHSAVQTGNVEAATVATGRYKVITPDALQYFPTHNMALATRLKYSPNALKRIKSLIAGRDAYIVPHVPSQDDISVADTLGVPILVGDLEVSRAYNTKVASRKIFQDAQLEVPWGDTGLWSESELIEKLAWKTVEFPEVTKWITKIDDEFAGRGIAVYDVTKLDSWPVLQREYQKQGSKWRHAQWAWEPLLNRLLLEIPALVHSCETHNNIPPAKYLKNLFSRGGVLEATPPGDVSTTLSVDLLVQPHGNVEVLASGDQLHVGSEFHCWGSTMPQTSVDCAELNPIIDLIGRTVAGAGLRGHMSVDIVSWLDESEAQRFWLTDLSIHYSDQLASSRLLHFLTRVTFDPVEHLLLMPRRIESGKKKRVSLRPQASENRERYAVVSSALQHSNLRMVHYGVFFQMCRAHGIGFDVKEGQGTSFSLIDSRTREYISMVTVCDNAVDALTGFARNLNVIHKEISSPTMPGDNNFMEGVKQIGIIVGETLEEDVEKTLKGV